MRKVISATQARKQFSQLLKIAGTPGSSVTITIYGHNPVIIMPLKDFERWQETVEVMSDIQLTKDIREGMRDKKAGRVIPLTKVLKKLSKK